MTRRDSNPNRPFLELQYIDRLLEFRPIKRGGILCPWVSYCQGTYLTFKRLQNPAPDRRRHYLAPIPQHL